MTGGRVDLATTSSTGSGLPTGGGALQVVGKNSSGVSGWLPTLQIVLNPSGDTSGVTDRVAINAALASYATVILASPGSRFWVDRTIQVNSNNTVILANARVTLIAGANCNILANANALAGGTQNYGGTADSAMRVKAVGVGWLDGNASNQTTPAAPNQLSQVGVFWCNATDVAVEDVIVGPVVWMACCSVGTSDLRWSRMKINQDRSVPNQDAIDVGPGCSNIQIEHTRGTSGDDCHSIWAKHGAASPSNLCAWLTAANSAGASNLNTSDVRIVNTNVDVGINCVRVQAGDGATLKGVHVSDFVKRGAIYQPGTFTHSVLQFGTETYITTPPTDGALSDITLDGFSGATDWLIGADSNFSDVVVKNAHITGAFKAVIGHTVATNTSVHDIEVDVNTSDNSGVQNNLIAAIAGDSWDRFKIKARMKSSNGVFVNAGTVTNLHADVEVANCTAAPYQSTAAETGVLQRLRLSARPAIIFGTAPGMKLGQDVPYLTASDATPTAVAGSQLVCRSDKDPTGGSHGVGSLYVGDGVAWNRVIDLPNLSVPTGPGLVKMGGNAGGSVTSTMAITVPAGGHAVGNLLLIAAHSTSASGTAALVTGVTDTRGNTYTVDKAAVGASTTLGASIASSKLTTALQAGDTVTVTYASSADTNMIVDSAEFLITGLTGAADKTATNSSATGVTALDGGTTATTAQASEIAIGAFSASGADGGSTAGSGFTKLNDLANVEGGVTRVLIWEYKILVATAAVNPTATITTAHAFTGVTATYK